MTTTKKLKCPDCDKTFDSVKALGPHRNKVHGYRISDGKNDPARAQKPGQPRPIKKPEIIPAKKVGGPGPQNRGEFPCPQCDFVAAWTGGLTKHMTAIHNTGAHPCPVCSRTFNNKNGLAKHMYAAHQISAKQRSELLAKGNQNAITVAATNGHVQQQKQQAQAPTISETTLAVAYGRFTELCNSMAYEFDLPPRMFAAELATLIARARSQIRH